MRIKYAIAWLLFSAGSVFAQANTAELSGSITDSSGGVLREVAVVLTQEATGVQRATRTNDVGAYYFLQLAPGPYRLAAVLGGFQAAVRSGIRLMAGHEASIDLQLVVAGMAQQTVVSVEALTVDVKSTALSGAIDNHSIRELPLNGRDLAQLAMLEPGVSPSRRTSDSGGAGTKLVAGGSRPSQVSFVLDGADINDANNNTPGSVAGVLLGVDTLQEFRVYTNAYSAELGRSGGAVISAITRSGTNTPHGSFFEFLRNSRFDARNFFDPLDRPIPAFQRNQFGAELEGPIIRNRTFFLVSGEGLRQSLGVTERSVVPDAGARAGQIPGLAPIKVAPGVAPYLNLIPLPGGQNFGDGTGELITSTTQTTGENFFTGRVDHALSEKTFLFGRYTLDSASVHLPDGLQLFRADNASRNQYATIQATRIVSEHAVSEFHLSYNRSESSSLSSSLRNLDPSLSFVPGDPLGQISVTGLFSLGPSRFAPTFSTMNLYQVDDEISWTHGHHSVKAGIDYRSLRLPTSRPQSPFGYYQFSSLAGFLQGQASAVEFTALDSNLSRDWRQSMAAGYLQDDVKIGRRLSLNLGVRYERESVPREAHGWTANLRDPLHDAAPTSAGPLFRNPTNLNFAPRAGAAWDPFGDGKTAVRAGFGIFYDPLWTDFYANAGNRQPPYYTLGSVRNPSFPNLNPSAAVPGFVPGRLDVIPYQPQSPYTMQFNFTIQRELWQHSSVTLSYAGERGLHLARLIDANQALPQILPDGRKFFPVGSVERNRNFTGIRQKVTDGHSYYNAFEAGFDHRWSGGFGMHTNYTWSKNIDDGSITTTQGGDNDMPQDPDSRKAERGLSNYDLRHYLVTSLTWDVPNLGGPKWLGAGWQMSAIGTAASGNPFSVVVGFDRARAKFQAGTSPQRPDLAAGASNNPVMGGPDRYFDPSAFLLPQTGFYGNLGRNTLIGPGLANVDCALNKRIRVGERLAAQFRGELFNVVNHPNFAIPSQRTVFSANGPVGSAGRITSTATASRQLQLGIKLSF